MKRHRAIAEYYDFEYPHHDFLEQDVPFFLGQMQKRKGQSVLEIAAGTGRAAIPVAQAGHRVVGMDYAKDMLDIARRKRDAVGLTDRELRLVHADALRLNLRERFDWICVFFNTFLAFPTLEEQDRLMGVIVRHLAPNGRFWVDLFQPDYGLLAADASEGLEPFIFYVPPLGRTVFKTTDIRRSPHRQVQRVTFNYRWFENDGVARQAKTHFDMTWMFAREFQLLVERHGLRVERLFGNYDGSALTDDSPRIIARCCRA
jgi:ubiquinone/menaquinone biosynthesis C-methylase UbiE